MNHRFLRRRRALAALSATAVALGISAWGATGASAAGVTLAFGPTATSATITNVDVTSTSSPTRASLAYGFKVTGLSGTDPLYIANDAGSAGALKFARTPSNTYPSRSTTLSVTTAAIDTSITVASTTGMVAGEPVYIGSVAKVISAVTDATHLALTAAVGSIVASGATVVASYASTFASAAGGTPAAISSYTSGDSIYVGVSVPGDYTFSVFQDHNGNGLYESAQDDSTPAFTLHVKDVGATGTTVTTSDDLNFGLTAPSTASVGDTITATLSPGLTMVDTRGGTVLGTNLAAGLSVAFTGVATGTVNPVTVSGSTFTATSGAASGAGTATSTATFTAGSGAPSTAAASTTVSSNNVTAVSLAATQATGTVATSGTAVTVKTSTPAVEYKAQITTADTDKSGKFVFFTLTPGTNTPGLTADATLVSNTSGVKVYKQATDSDGVATVHVTSDTMTAGTTYTVVANSNGNASSTLTATYAAAAANSINITSTAAQLTPTVGSGVTVQGQLLDQFGAAYSPSVSQTQQVQLFAGAAGGTCAALGTTQATSGAVANGTLSSGTFSLAYTPGTTPTAGQCSAFLVGYDTSANGSVIPAEPEAAGTINWASAAAPGSITLTHPANSASVTLSSSSTVAANTVDGTVYDAGSAAMAFKTVTLSGGDGVYFSTTTGSTLTSTLAVVSNSSGVYAARAYFTKAGSNSVTATAGTGTDMVTATSAVTVADSVDPYTVGVDDAFGTPGSTLVVTGLVNDMFDNPVANEYVHLGTGTSTIGVLGSTDVMTNSDGVFSTTFVTGSNQSGDVTLTATLYTAGQVPPSTGHLQVANRTPAGGWTATGLTNLPNGLYVDTGTITVQEPEPDRVTLVAPALKVNEGHIRLNGTAPAGSNVDIYVKSWGETTYALMDTVTVADDGTWTDVVFIDQVSSYIAKSEGAISSSVETTRVASTVAIGASQRGLRSGYIRLASAGNPLHAGTYTWVASINGHSRNIAHGRTTAGGRTNWVWHSGRGRFAVKVYFAADGANTGVSSWLFITVR